MFWGLEKTRLFRQLGRYRRCAVSIVILHRIHSLVHGIVAHQTRIVRLENLPHGIEVFNLGIQPKVVFIGRDDDWHPVMDVGEKSVGSGGKDRTTFDDFPFGISPFVSESADSKAINRVLSGAIIMAGSGMCTGGRVRHHLRNNLGREEASIVFVGYAAKGTLARHIIDGVKLVRLFGEQIPVRAKIYTIGGFSAHADQTELLQWHGQTHADRTVLVHGDEEVMRHFAARLKNTQVEMPNLNQTIEL